MSSLSEEWKTVTKDDKKRVMRKRGRGRGSKRLSAAAASAGNSQQTTTCTTTTSSPVLEDKEQLEQVLMGCMHCLRSTRFYENLSNILMSSSDEEEGSESFHDIRQMICYGLGNFSRTSVTDYSASLWQLACLLCIQHLLQKTMTSDDDDEEEDKPMIPIYYYDPCTTAFEERFLADRNVNVLTINDRGKRSVGNTSTLFFMPHCPSRLYENVLWANWNELVIKGTKIAFVGNSFRNHCDGLQRTDCPCMRALLPHLDELPLVQSSSSSTVDVKEAPGNFLGAFNDTYLTFLRPLKMTKWPERPYDSPKDDEGDQELL